MVRVFAVGPRIWGWAVVQQLGSPPPQPERPELHLGLLQVENSISKLGDASQCLPCWDTALMLPPLSSPQ